MPRATIALPHIFTKNILKKNNGKTQGCWGLLIAYNTISTVRVRSELPLLHTYDFPHCQGRYVPELLYTPVIVDVYTLHIHRCSVTYGESAFRQECVNSDRSRARGSHRCRCLLGLLHPDLVRQPTVLQAGDNLLTLVQNAQDTDMFVLLGNSPGKPLYYWSLPMYWKGNCTLEESPPVLGKKSLPVD